MSQANIQLIQKIYDAFVRGDVHFIFSAVAPEVEVFQSPELPWGGEYRRPEGLRQFLTKLTSHVDSTVTIERYLDAGEDIVTIGRTRGKVNANGRPFDVPVAHIWRVQNGVVCHFHPFIDIPTMQAALRC